MSAYDMPKISPAPSRDDEYVLRDLVGLIIDQIWYVLGIAVIISAVAVTYAKLATPVYVADALVQLDTQSPNTPNNNQTTLPSVLLPGPSVLYTAAEIEIIQSRAVLDPVIDRFKLNLSAVPHTFPVLGKFGSWFAREGHPLPAPLGLDSYAWGGEVFAFESLSVPATLLDQRLTLRALGQDRFALFDPDHRELLRGRAGSVATGNGVTLLVSRLIARPGTEFYVARSSPLEASQNFADDLQVNERGKDTGIVEIAFSGDKPVFITDVANAVAVSYLKQRTERAQEEANRMLTFLNAELPRVRDELRASETALAQYQKSAGSFQPTQEAQTYLSSGLDYERQIASLQMLRVQLLQRFTAGADEVRSVDAQLAALEAQKARFETQFETLPGSERQALSLEREAKVNAEIYIALLNKTQELAISRAGIVGNVHIVDQASVPSRPVKPKATMIIAAGTLLGLMAGMAFAFLRDLYFIGVSDPERVERRFNLPVLGAIPFSAEQGRIDLQPLEHPFALSPSKSAAAGNPAGTEQSTSAMLRRKFGFSDQSQRAETIENASVVWPSHGITQPLLSTTCPFDLSVEGLRGVRANLQFALVDAPNRVIAITSPAPFDGKSFLSANLAALLAESGQRVLLIDADLRRGCLAKYLGQSPNGGLTELLVGQSDVDTAVGETGVRGLHFISAGARPPNPSEILTSSRFARLLQALEKQFDLIIVDTSPLLAVPDAAVIASLAGSTLLVLRSGAHSEQHVADALKKLNQGRARIVGAVLNAKSARSASRNGTYGYAFAHTYSGDPLCEPAITRRP